MDKEEKGYKSIFIDCIRCKRGVYLQVNAKGTRVIGKCPICSAIYDVRTEQTPFKG